MSGVWAFSEDASLAAEMANAADEVAGSLSGARFLVKIEGVSAESGNSGTTLWLKGGGLSSDPAVLAEAIARAARSRNPRLILIAATRRGRTVASMLSAKLRVGCLSEVHSLKIEGSAVEADREVYAGKVTARLRAALPCVATVKAGAYRPAEGGPAEGEVENVGNLESKVHLVSESRKEGGIIDLRKAPVIVAAGRGFRKKEDVAMAEQLAEALGGAVGCSRPLSSDYGWLPEECHIGLTGRTVSPSLYLALGISGQLQHVAGIKESRLIVAVNTDRDAPIFQVADYGIVGDLYQVIPQLLKVISMRR